MGVVDLRDFGSVLEKVKDFNGGIEFMCFIVASCLVLLLWN